MQGGANQTAGQLLFALLDHVYGLYYSTPTTLTLVSLDPTDGNIVWRRSIEGLLASSSRIFFAGNALVTGGDFGLRAINPATSEVLWQNGESVTSLATGN